MQKYDEQNRIQYFGDILLLIGLFSVSIFVAQLLAAYLVVGAYGLAFSDLISGSIDLTKDNTAKGFLVAQGIGSIGAFGLSSWIYIQIKRYNFSTTINLKFPKKPFFLLVVPVLFIALSMIVSELMIFSQWLQKQTWASGLMGKESGSSASIEKILVWVKTPDRLLFGLLFMSLIPALTEEIFFRGILQKLSIGLFNNEHLGIILTSLIFAAIHLNPSQILPMFFLALALGYSYHYSKSILVPFLLHLLNNSVAVLVNYFSANHSLSKQLAEDSFQPPPLVVVIAVVVTAAIFIRFRQLSLKKEINE